MTTNGLKNRMMFPGLPDFERVVRGHTTGIDTAKLDKLFEDLKREFRFISIQYIGQTTANMKLEGFSETESLSKIAGLQEALLSLKQKPFSEVISPYVDTNTGNATDLGNLLIMSSKLAERINGPDSRIVRLMKSLEGEGVSFESMAKDSYEAFDYAKASIALSQSTGNAAPTKPLLWLPLGNSLFADVVKNHIDHHSTPATVVNLGAGPGGLENIFASNPQIFGDKVHVISVEMDSANLDSLRKTSASLPNQTTVDGDFVNPAIQKIVTRLISSDSTPFVVAGYALHHISPDKTGGLVKWMQDMAGQNGGVQIHDVSGGIKGGGQSQVNRLFFNFMPAYHLLVFHPNSYYLDKGFFRVDHLHAANAVVESPQLFIPGTTPENASQILKNGTMVALRH